MQCGQVAADRAIQRLGGADNQDADLWAWLLFFSSHVDPELTPVGRPEADHGWLLTVYTEWLATKKNPEHGKREFARQRMGAKSEQEIRAALEALRRARKWATEQGIDPDAIAKAQEARKSK